MTSIRNLFAVLLCVMLVIPAAAFAPCCCTGVDAEAQSCSAEESSCCAPEKTRCCDLATESKGCDRSCTCVVCIPIDATINRTTIELETSVEVHFYPAEFDVSDRMAEVVNPIFRPPISHNGRQAMLCVWRK